MQASLILPGSLLGLWGDVGVEHSRFKFSRSENGESLEEKFDSGWLSLHVLSIP